MRIEIFYYSDAQRRIADKLKDLIRAHIYPAAAPTLHDAGTFEKDEQMAWRYIQLLGAAIHLDRDIEFLQSFPLRAQKMVRQAGFYAPRVLAGTWSFDTEEQKHFFPALGIRDQMVMVPFGLSRLIQHKFNIEPATSAKEVDFSNDAALNDALKEIAETLRRDVRRDLLAHASYVYFKKDDLAPFAPALGVDEAFLHHIRESLPMQEGGNEVITCEVTPTTIPRGCWATVNLRIGNTSQGELSNVNVKVNGPLRIRPKSIEISIPPTSTHQIELSILSDVAGEFPIELVFTLPDDSDLTHPVRHVWLKCE